MTAHTVSWKVRATVHCSAFADLPSAKTLYDILGTRYAKCIVAHPSGAVIEKFGDAPHLRASIAAVPAFQAAIDARWRTMRPPVVVSWHALSFGPLCGGYADAVSARAAYDILSAFFAAVIVDSVSGNTIASYGGERWVDECEAAVPGFLRGLPQRFSPAFGVAWEAGAHCAGFLERDAAQLAYDAVSSEGGKGLVELPKGDVIESDGVEEKALKSFDAIPGFLRRFPQEKTEFFAVAWESPEGVVCSVYGDVITARAAYGDVSGKYTKVLVEESTGDVLEQSGKPKAVLKCLRAIHKFVDGLLLSN